MSLWIRNLIFIGIIVLSSEAVGSSSYIIEKSDCRGKEITASFMQSRLEWKIRSVSKVYDISFQDAWIWTLAGDFYVFFSVETYEGDVYENIKCKADIQDRVSTRGIKKKNYFLYVWSCGNGEIEVNSMEIPIQCPSKK